MAHDHTRDPRGTTVQPAQTPIIPDLSDIDEKWGDIVAALEPLAANILSNAQTVAERTLAANEKNGRTFPNRAAAIGQMLKLVLPTALSISAAISYKRLADNSTEQLDLTRKIVAGQEDTKAMLAEAQKLVNTLENL